MTDTHTPRAYPDWRLDSHGRAEDAAYLFGFHMMTLCKEAALQKIPEGAADEMRTVVESAVDTALYNMMNLLEGFYLTTDGQEQRVGYSLVVQIENEEGDVIEAVPLSPCLLDLPIGYWKWRDGEFR